MLGKSFPMALLALAACGDSSPATPEAPTTPSADAPPGAPDAPVAKNPHVLWLNGINGSESNLNLVAVGPPNPF
jgi:hypothetical protein